MKLLETESSPIQLFVLIIINDLKNSINYTAMMDNNTSCIMHIVVVILSIKNVWYLKKI